MLFEEIKILLNKKCFFSSQIDLFLFGIFFVVIYKKKKQSRDTFSSLWRGCSLAKASSWLKKEVRHFFDLNPFFCSCLWNRKSSHSFDSLHLERCNQLLGSWETVVDCCSIVQYQQRLSRTKLTIATYSCLCLICFILLFFHFVLFTFERLEDLQTNERDSFFSEQWKFYFSTRCAFHVVSLSDDVPLFEHFFFIYEHFKLVLITLTALTYFECRVNTYHRSKKISPETPAIEPESWNVW